MLCVFLTVPPFTKRHDPDSETWPVPNEVAEDYRKLKRVYRVVPLAIYDDHDHFVETLQADQALKNALVEIHFSIIHYKIGAPGDAHESFTAEPKQIIILKTAPVTTPTAYKRKNIRSGPVRPKKFDDFRK